MDEIRQYIKERRLFYPDIAVLTGIPVDELRRDPQVWDLPYISDLLAQGPHACVRAVVMDLSFNRLPSINTQKDGDQLSGWAT